MKVYCLIVIMCCVTSLCVAEQMTIWAKLVEVTVDNSAAQRKYAVFKTNGHHGYAKTFKIPLNINSKNVDKNKKNIITLIRQFPTEAFRSDKGLILKPKGLLSFMVPLNIPETKINEWELAQMSVKEKAEQPD